MKGNKWLHSVVPAFLIHLTIGVIYCWSSIKLDFARELNVNVAELESTFSWAIFTLGIMAMLSGISRFNTGTPRTIAILTWVICMLGLGGLAWSIHVEDVNIFRFSFGFLLGAAVGLGYMRPILNILAWFPEKGAGVAAGIAITGFGLSKAIFAPFIPWLNDVYGMENTIYILMGIGSLTFLIATILIRRPENWVAPIRLGFRDLVYLTFKGSFYRIWLMFFLVVACGLAIISFETGLGEELKLDNIPMFLALSAIFNALGRFVGGMISDHLRRKEISFVIITALAGIVGLVIVLVGKFSLVTTLAFIIAVNLGYGACFTTLPLLLKQRFPAEVLSPIYGLALSAWGFAGFLGSGLGNFVIYEHNGKYIELVAIVSVLYFIALVVALTLMMQKKFRANLSNLLYFQEKEKEHSERK